MELIEKHVKALAKQLNKGTHSDELVDAFNNLRYQALKTSREIASKTEIADHFATEVVRDWFERGTDTDDQGLHPGEQGYGNAGFGGRVFVLDDADRDKYHRFDEEIEKEGIVGTSANNSFRRRGVSSNVDLEIDGGGGGSDEGGGDGGTNVEDSFRLSKY